MEKGEVRNDEIIKVIDYMKTLTPKELLEAQTNTVARKFERMRNQWIFFLEETNEAGVLDVMIKAFEEATDLLKTSAKWLKENQKEFDAFGRAVKEVYSVVKILVKGLATVFVNALEAAGAFFFMIKDGGWASVGVLGSILLLLPKIQAAAAIAGAALWRAFVVPAAVIGAILLVDDLINALLGRNSLIASAAKEDGFLGTLAATFLMIGETLSLIGQLFTSIFVEGDLQLAGIYVDEFFKKFTDNFPKLSSLFSDLATWVSSLFTNIAQRFGMMIGVAKAYASLDFKKVNELISKMESVSLSPTAQQMNPQDYMRSLPASSYGSVPTLLSNNPQQNITINAGNQSPEQIATEIRKQWDSIASMSYAQSMTNYGALQ